MAYLNKNGWITYVILKNDRGERQGSIVQVHVVRLPMELWRKERVIQFALDGSYKIYDFDGRTQLSKKEFNAGWSAPDDEVGEVNGASKELEVEGPLPQDPEDWVSGDQYKGDPKGEPQTPSGEGAEASVPLEEELCPGPAGPGHRVETVTESSCPGAQVDDSGATVVSEDSAVPVIDWRRVRKMALRSRDSEERRAAYYKHLVEAVVPVLTDPPVKSKHWTAAENIAWCRDSVKGQFVLSCAVEDEWPADLARSFRRSESACSLSDCLILLRTGVFAENSPVALKLLVSGKKSERGTAWKSMMETARRRDQTLKEELGRRIKDFPKREKLDENLKARADQYMWWAIDDAYLFPEAATDDLDLFFRLLSVHFRQLRGEASGNSVQWIHENHEDVARRMARVVASNKLAAVLALRNDWTAGEVWGFKWDDVRREYAAIAEELAMGAELYGSKQRISPDIEIFEQGPELDPATRDMLQELARERRSRAMKTHAPRS
ncbi:MAG: hypothetical protein KDN18_12200 [Verrucomicrobiae bacterium]|nr:hypothetical protein [Verrucomicrobiae bacterium]